MTSNSSGRQRAITHLLKETIICLKTFGMLHEQKITYNDNINEKFDLFSEWQKKNQLLDSFSYPLKYIK